MEGLSKWRFLRSRLCFVLICVFILFISSELAFSQQVKANVKVMLERLPLLKQKKLKDFAEEIEYYLNDYNWTDEASDDEIPISMQIFLTDKSVSFEDRYAGTILISNNLDIQYTDKYWNFPYQQGERLIHNENAYNPFTGLLDFYVYLILGGEYDKYGRLLGTPFYEKAKHISDQAQFNSQFIYGWEEREVKISSIMSDEYLSFRTMKDLFFLGLVYVGEEDTTAQKYCREALKLLDDFLYKQPDHKDAILFLKAHHIEFVDVLKDDQDAIKTLLTLDPDNENTYKRYLK